MSSLTTNNGAPLPDNEHSLTAGTRGPVLMQDFQLTEKLAAFARERIPERVVHAKGAGAFGYFEATADMSAHTKAHIFSKAGRRTPALARFSTVGGEKRLGRCRARSARFCAEILYRGRQLRPCRQ